MKQPTFDSDGVDESTFFPFTLENMMDSEWKCVLLSFGEWDWFTEKHGSDTINDYYMNGYGVEGLVKAARHSAGLEAEPDSIDFDSEGDFCRIEFSDMNDAVETANLTSTMISDATALSKAIVVARENGFED